MKVVLGGGCRPCRCGCPCCSISFLRSYFFFLSYIYARHFFFLLHLYWHHHHRQLRFIADCVSLSSYSRVITKIIDNQKQNPIGTTNSGKKNYIKLKKKNSLGTKSHLINLRFWLNIKHYATALLVLISKQLQYYS